ncbi:MAG: hypothetical protein ACM3QU_10825 [Verrucomicrobiota bacterium]
MSARRHGTAAISVLLVLLGLAVIVRTVQAGVGGGLGLLMGGLLVAAGALRLSLAVKLARRPGKARSAPRRRAS